MGSNQRLPPCRGDTLPAELIAHNNPYSHSFGSLFELIKDPILSRELDYNISGSELQSKIINTVKIAVVLIPKVSSTMDVGVAFSLGSFFW